MQKKIPMRQCLGCREMKPKKELIRAVRSADGSISLDFKGKASGRGAYVCPNGECLKKAIKSKAFEKAFYDKLQKGHKRCKLIVCTVVGDSAYEETKIIVEKMTFEECYSTMKNSGEQAVVRQFFKIVEMNWNGSKVVDEWRYYQNGDFIQENDEDLCKKLMVAEYATKVQWQG